MAEFVYTVTVICDSREEADDVIGERLNHDEDYGFPYALEVEFLG